MNRWARRRSRLQMNFPGRVLLGAASLAYGAGVYARKALYDLKILPRRKVDAKVVCIGNLTTGGTGKTPAVLLAAETLRHAGHEVSILSRGYRREARAQEVTVLLDDHPIDWRQCGDEPWMIHQSLKGQGVSILVCSDRAKAGAMAVERYGSRVIILDDGFQHLKLHRDMDIVLVNARDPFGGRRLLPLGNLREPVSALRRASLVVITHADRVTAPELSALHQEILAIHPHVPIVEAAHKATHILDVRTEEKRPLTSLRGKSLVVLSGLGDPLSFELQLEHLGASRAQTWRYPDHHAYTPRELRSIESLRGNLALATTYKDFVRLPQGWREILKGEVLVLGVTLDIIRGRNLWLEALESLVHGGSKKS